MALAMAMPMPMPMPPTPPYSPERQSGRGCVLFGFPLSLSLCVAQVSKVLKSQPLCGPDVGREIRFQSGCIYFSCRLCGLESPTPGLN